VRTSPARSRRARCACRSWRSRTSLPFVIDEWTLAGTVSTEGTATDIRAVGPPEPQTATFPRELSVADFP
jgi:hypothetical protein